MPEMSYDLYESTFQVNALVYEPYIAIVMVRHELNADTSSLVWTIVCDILYKIRIIKSRDYLILKVEVLNLKPKWWPMLREDYLSNIRHERQSFKASMITLLYILNRKLIFPIFLLKLES